MAPLRRHRSRGSIVLVLIGGLAAIAAPSARAAVKPQTFVFSASGTERQDWTAAANGAPCAQHGTGTQIVSFTTKRTTTHIVVQHSKKGDYVRFTNPEGLLYALNMDAGGTVTSTNDTTYNPPALDPCYPIPKDCGTHTLDPATFQGSSDQPGHFVIAMRPDLKGRMGLTGQYWGSQLGPFTGCVAMQTPEGCCADDPGDWLGPQFGDQMWEGAGAPATAPVKLLTLKRGHTYRFGAKATPSLTLDSSIRQHGHNGAGQFSMDLSGAAVDDLSNPRTVNYTIAWTITVKRIS